MSQALSGIRIIDMTHNQAAPACADFSLAARGRSTAAPVDGTCAYALTGIHCAE